MRLVYTCKHCHSFLGQIDGSRVDDRRLGLSILSVEERADVISYDLKEDVAYVNTICEFCQEALEANPELALLHSPLQ